MIVQKTSGLSVAKRTAKDIKDNGRTQSQWQKMSLVPIGRTPTRLMGVHNLNQ